MDQTRCLAMTATPFLMIVQCELGFHPGKQHHAHVDTPMGVIGVNWVDRERKDD